MGGNPGRVFEKRARGTGVSRGCNTPIGGVTATHEVCRDPPPLQPTVAEAALRAGRVAGVCPPHPEGGVDTKPGIAGVEAAASGG